jgi:hypothetical protein
LPTHPWHIWHIPFCLGWIWMIWFNVWQTNHKSLDPFGLSKLNQLYISLQEMNVHQNQVYGLWYLRNAPKANFPDIFPVEGCFSLFTTTNYHVQETIITASSSRTSQTALFHSSASRFENVWNQNKVISPSSRTMDQPSPSGSLRGRSQINRHVHPKLLHVEHGARWWAPRVLVDPLQKWGLQSTDIRGT